MLTNLFSARTVGLVVTATALFILLAANAFLEQRRGDLKTLDQPQKAQAMGRVTNPDTYYPLPPGKQTTSINAAIQACLHQVHEAQTISRAAKPATYYPLPPGKQTGLVNAVIQACIDAQLAGVGWEKSSN
jgi:hypothetical protein